MPLSAWILAGAMALPVDSPPIHTLLTGVTRLAVILSVAGALQRLDAPVCREVLTDFRDATGRSLAERFESTGLTFREYVAQLYAVSGDGEPQCAAGSIVAFTKPGTRVIFICSAGFSALLRRRSNAEVIVIHEILHTLGLGENPPTTNEITAHVRRRCA
jgi:hypothetical protein